MRHFTLSTLIFILGVAFLGSALVSESATKVKKRREKRYVIKRKHEVVKSPERKEVTDQKPTKQVEKIAAVKQIKEAVGSVLRLDILDDRMRVWVTIVDQNFQPVKGVGKEYFKLTETTPGVGGRRIPDSELKIDKHALAVTLLRDVSGSMGPLDRLASKHALHSYFSNMSPSDQSELIYFSNSIRIVQHLTNDKHILTSSLERPFEQGGTALYDAVVFAINRLQSIEGAPVKRAVILLTDGEDGSSSYSLEETLRLAASAAIPIFAIAIDAADPRVLQKLAEVSRGRYFHVNSINELTTIYDRISDLFSNSYILSFPSSGQPGDNVEVEVEVAPTEGHQRVSRFYGRHVIK